MSFPEQANRPAEPSWFHENLLPGLHLPVDLPVHFIGDKIVNASDFDQRQNRFRLPAYCVMRSLRPIVTAEELLAANMGYEDDHDVPTQSGRGRGLPVWVVDTDAGIIELQMSRWESCPGVTIKGQGYIGFITECSFTVRDVVQNRACKQHAFSPLYLVLARKP